MANTTTISEEADDNAAAGSVEPAEESAEPVVDGDDDVSPAAPPSPPDVCATRAALDAVVKEKDLVHVENNLLSDHLMVPSLCLSVCSFCGGPAGSVVRPASESMNALIIPHQPLPGSIDRSSSNELKSSGYHVSFSLLLHVGEEIIVGYLTEFV